MAFKLKSPYNIDWTPIYHVKEEEGVNGRANKNGTILLDEDMSPTQEINTISHEMTHVKQFKDFNESNGKKGLDYEDDFITWQGQRMPRRNGKILYKGKWRPEGWPQFPWEKEAYDNEIDIT
tara:strand:+ start:230 stop:595 length:366 start_codon:yes stop_codon:yes gene_type:complete